MTMEELIAIQYDLKLQKSNGQFKDFALFADGKMLNTDEAIEWIENQFSNEKGE